MTEKPPDKTALNRARALCAQYEYSAGDIRTKLHLWGINTSDTEEIIATLVKENFLNDARYAAEFLRDKLYNKKWGKIKISSLLRAKSIPDEIIRSVLETVDDEYYRNTIKEILSSHRKFIKAKNKYDLKGKLLRYGLSKGYESHLLYDILNDLDL